MNYHIIYRGTILESFSAKDQKSANKYANKRYSSGSCKMFVFSDAVSKETFDEALKLSLLPK